MLHAQCAAAAAPAEAIRSRRRSPCPRASAAAADEPQTLYLLRAHRRQGRLSLNSRDNNSSRASFGVRGYEDATNNRGSGHAAGRLSRAGPAGHRPDRAEQCTRARRYRDRHLDGHQPGHARHARGTTGPTASSCRATPSLDGRDIELGRLRTTASWRSARATTVTVDARLPDGIGGELLPPRLHRRHASRAHRRAGPGRPWHRMGSVPEFQDEGNNITARLHAGVDGAAARSAGHLGHWRRARTPCDPAMSWPGSPFTVTYQVTNAGAGATPDRQGVWTTISTCRATALLTDADLLLGDACGTRAGWRPARATRTLDVQRAARPARALVRLRADRSADAYSPATGNVFEADKETTTHGTTARRCCIDQPPPSDLVVDSRSRVPNGAMAGDTVHLTWTVNNVGVNAASGAGAMSPISPRQYLGHQRPADRRFDFNGTRAAERDRYTGTLDAGCRRRTPGTYRIIVRTDIFDDIVEAPTTATTPRPPPALFRSPCRSCSLGVALDTTLSTGQDRLYPGHGAAGPAPCRST